MENWFVTISREGSNDEIYFKFDNVAGALDFIKHCSETLWTERVTFRFFKEDAL